MSNLKYKSKLWDKITEKVNSGKYVILIDDNIYKFHLINIKLKKSKKMSK